MMQSVKGLAGLPLDPLLLSPQSSEEAALGRTVLSESREVSDRISLSVANNGMASRSVPAAAAAADSPQVGESGLMEMLLALPVQGKLEAVHTAAVRLALMSLCDLSHNSYLNDGLAAAASSTAEGVGLSSGAVESITTADCSYLAGRYEVASPTPLLDSLQVQALARFTGSLLCSLSTSQLMRATKQQGYKIPAALHDAVNDGHPHNSREMASEMRIKKQLSPDDAMLPDASAGGLGTATLMQLLPVLHTCLMVLMQVLPVLHTCLMALMQVLPVLHTCLMVLMQLLPVLHTCLMPLMQVLPVLHTCLMALMQVLFKAMLRASNLLPEGVVHC
jgi:hypothetical protein